MLSRLRESGLSLGMKGGTHRAGTADGMAKGTHRQLLGRQKRKPAVFCSSRSHLGTLISAKSRACHRHTARARHRELPGLAESKLKCHKPNIPCASSPGLAGTLGTALASLHKENFGGNKETRASYPLCPGISHMTVSGKKCICHKSSVKAERRCDPRLSHMHLVCY